MYQRICLILCYLSCAILVMPQGWCCWLAPMQYCAVEEKKSCCEQQKKSSAACCCQQQKSKDKDAPATPLPVKCAKCIHDTIKPSSPHAIDMTLSLVGLLPVDVHTRLADALTSIAHLHGAGPPLHVQLCVWRC